MYINNMEDGLGDQGYILPCPVVRGSHLMVYRRPQYKS